MNPARFPIVLVAACPLVLGVAGCGGGKKEISEIDRKQAAHHASEAQFALTLRDLPRAEESLAKATALTPDDGALWVSLGATRVRLGKKDLAQQAYQGALKAYADEAKQEKSGPEPWLKQVYVLALLGRKDDARTMLAKTAKQFPEHRNVKLFVEGKQLDAMLADPKFKEMAL
jgi:Flp pilus assembly protein TadD